MIHALLLVSLLNPAVLAGQASSAEVIGTVSVINETTGQSQSVQGFAFCSAFTIAPGVTATAKHCTEPELDITDEGIVESKTFPKYLMYYNGAYAKILHIWRSDTTDLAFLYTNDRSKPIVTINNELYQGQRGYVYGDAGPSSFALSPATVMQGNVLRDEMITSATVAIDCPSCFYGDSGAAVYDDFGDVIGMVIGGSAQPEVIFMLPSEFLEEALLENAR